MIKDVIISVYPIAKEYKSKILEANYFEEEKIYLPWSEQDIKIYLKNNQNSMLISESL